MGRPSVHKITDGGSMREGSFLANLQKIGFRRVTFSDGYDYSVYYTLDPPDESAGGSVALVDLGLDKPLILN